jgi:cobaltochelatase CobS
VEPHPNFRVFGTANTVGCMSAFRHLYQGTNLMNEAFLDRWRVYHVDYLAAEQEVKVLVDTVERMNTKIATVIVRVGNMIREAFRKEEIACTFSLRRMIDWAELMVRHREPLKAAEASIFSKISPEDAEVITGIIKRVMVGQPSA